MAVKIPGGSGFSDVNLPNADSSSVAALQSTNSGQPAGAAFDQFQGVVLGDQNTLNTLGAKIATLQASGNLTPAQQTELLTDVQQYEKGAEKFKSDNAHLIQLAAADQSNPEAKEAIYVGNQVSNDIASVYNSVSTYTHSNSGLSPTIAASLGSVNGSIKDQALAIRNNDIAMESYSTSSGSTFTGPPLGSGNVNSATISSASTGTHITGQGANVYLPNVDPKTASAMASSNAGQPQGQAFSQFSQVVAGDQAQLNALTRNINSAKTEGDLTTAVQQYQKAAEKFVSDDAHLEQLGAADNNLSEVQEARALAAPQLDSLKTEAGVLRAVAGAGKLSASANATLSAVAGSLTDQANALQHNNTLTTPTTNSAGS